MAAGDETMGAAPAPKSAQARRKAMHPKSLFDEPAVLEAFERIKVKPAHAQRMWRYIVQQNVVNVRDIPDFPKVRGTVMVALWHVRICSVSLNSHKRACLPHVCVTLTDWAYLVRLRPS